MANFSAKDVERVKKAGFNVEAGFIGDSITHINDFYYRLLRPIYEYHIYIYNSVFDEKEALAAVGKEAARTKAMFGALQEWRLPPKVRIALTGNTKRNDLGKAGIPSLAVALVDAGVSDLEMENEDVFSNAAIHELVKEIKPAIKLPVKQCVYHSGDHKGTYNIPCITTRSKQQIVSYGVDIDNENRLQYIALPQFVDNAHTIIEILKVLNATHPNLFPQAEKEQWIHSPEYEHPIILQLQHEIDEIEVKAKEQISKLSEKIGRECDDKKWIHDLITSHDKPLVSAVKKVLDELGFKNVKDVDAERDAAGKSRREDLQILDATPTIIVDIKGIGGLPSDVDALQANKHATIRMREWNRADVIPLSIVNHQRNIPPLARENEMPFRQEILDHAAETTIGLMTSWDLYRLFRNFRKHQWSPKSVQPLFYQSGRIQIVPIHYEYIGKIVHVWTEAFGVTIEEGKLSLKDKIAIEFPIEFEETVIDSMQIDSKPINAAEKGSSVGLSWPKKMPKVRTGMRVFKLNI